MTALDRLLETLGKPLSKDQQQAVKQWLPGKKQPPTHFHDCTGTTGPVGKITRPTKI